MPSHTDKFSIDGHKLHYHLDRVSLWQKDPLATYPIYVEISPVGHCNHRCTFCAVDYIGYKPRSLDANILRERLHEMGKLGIKSVMYAGEGEPILHKEICNIVNDTYEAGIDCAFTTNGVLLDKVFPVLNQVKWIKVSCNAGDPRTYSQVHKAKFSDFSLVWDNLRSAVKVRGKGTVIGVQAVFIPENAGSVENLVKMARDTGLDYCVIKPYSQHKSSITRTYEGVRYGEYAELLNRLTSYSTNTYEVIARTKSMEGLEKGRGYHKCYSTPYFWAYVMATGDVYGCSAYLLDERFKYGNINQEGFAQIWQGDKRKASMAFVDQELDISECRKNCRMDKVNQFLWEIKNPGEHANFI